MALFIWRGVAVARAQVCEVVAENIEAGDDFTLTINGVSFTARATGGTAEPIYADIASQITESEAPQLAGITAEAAGVYSAALAIIGEASGRPFAIESTADNGGVGEVSVATIQTAGAGRNEIQQVALPVGVTGGTFKLTFSGQETSGIAYNAAASAVETALEGLSNVSGGDVAVSGAAGGPYLIEFAATYAKTDVPALTVDTASLTAGAVSIAQTVEGSAGINEVQQLAINYDDGDERFYASWTGPSGNHHLLTQAGIDPSNYFSRGDAIDTAAKLKADMIASHPDLNVSNFDVELIGDYSNKTAQDATGGDEVDAGTDSRIYDHVKVYNLLFFGDLGGEPLNRINIGIRSQPGKFALISAATNIEGSSGGVNEEQTVSLTGSPSGGTFTLSYGGDTTSGIAYNAAASAVETALEGLTSIGSGDASVSGDAGGPWTVEFTGALAGQDVALMTGDGSSLTGGGASVSVTQTAIAAVNEVQQVSLSESVSGGTFTLSYAGQTTSALSYAISAAALETALEGLSNVDSVEVSGADGGPWEVEFQGSLAATNVASMTGDGASLSGDDSQSFATATLIEPTGPDHWDEPNNWDQGSVPVNGSDVRIENSDASIRYGLDQAGVTLDSLDIRASFTGDIGLPTQNDGSYYELLDTHLAIGATVVRIGEGEGGGTSLCRLDTGSAQTALTVYGTGTPSSAAGYAVEWIGTHAENVLTVNKGIVGVAVGAGETAVIDALNVGWVESRDSDSLVFLGDGATVGDIVKNGGELIVTGRSGTDVTSLKSTSGLTEMRGTDGVDSLTVEGGECFYWTTGTLGGETVVSGDGQLIFDGDMRAKTVTNKITLQGDAANVVDANETVENLRVRFQGTSRFAEFGSDIIITRGLGSEEGGESEVSASIYASAMQMVSVAVDSELETIATMLTTASYAHPSGKTEADIIQIDVVAPDADIAVHDADNDSDGQEVATDAVEYFPVRGAAATALRMVTDSSANVLLKIYYG
ncbi:MAG: hypothetical protein ACIALR_11435 [Blastopirellula sp. JB062]